MKAWTKVLSVAAAFLFVLPTQAQQPADKYEKQGDKVMVTKYYEDGTVREQGTFKGKVADGRWVEYHQNGEVKTEAFYVDGKKQGKWFVWPASEGEVMYELVYEDNLLKDSNRWTLDENNVADK